MKTRKTYITVMTNKELLKKIFGETKYAKYETYLVLNKEFTKEKPISKRKYLMIQNLIISMPGKINDIELNIMNNIAL